MELKVLQTEYNVDDLVREAQIRWLKPSEVFFIVQNHEKHQFTEQLPYKPRSGALFLYNKRVIRSFRRDGHSWRRKRDGKAAGEAHERLKVGCSEALSCYYAHGEENPNFQRRSYWMLDPACKDIVLVHYRDVNEGSNSYETPMQSSPVSVSNLSQMSEPYISPCSVVSDRYHPYHSSCSPRTAEAGFDTDFTSQVHLENSGDKFFSSTESEITQALRKLEHQLSLDDESSNDVSSFCTLNQSLNESEITISQPSNEPMNNFSLPGSKGNGLSFTTDGLNGLDNDITISLMESKIGAPTYATEPSFTDATKQSFMIQEISPEWGYATESTKVIIVGQFLCDPSDCSWACVIDGIEVPLQVIKEGGVLLCHAPPHKPGKVSLWITSGYRELCTHAIEFEYRTKLDMTCRGDSNKHFTSPGELLLLVQFTQLLLYDTGKKVNPLENKEDTLSCVIEDLLLGKRISGNVIELLFEELLRDKVNQWRGRKRNYSLSRKEQGIIHMVAALGFEWALNPILSCGVGVNFRDINGWTALHWASRFGREKMVAALLASGASACAVTDPNSQDPTGRTAAAIAASCGHKGLAGYLSEVALTAHLSYLDNTELPSAEPEIANDNLFLKPTLAAVRNAAQAAARIQAAFRAHSFRKRQQREASAADTCNIDCFSIASRVACDRNSAALSIQKRYQGWRDRRAFLELRQNVVKIQALVRGHQVRKKYKVICWAVGILEKVVLRWRRRGAGLRGFRSEPGMGSESDDDDVIKVFRKEKVEAAVEEAVCRVRAMVDSPEARVQYARMLQRFNQAKAELQSMSGIAGQMPEEKDSELRHY